jgi:5-(aminomethyl)-3-furanmethanol phosphate kinase
VSEPRPLVVKVGGGLLRDQGLDGLRCACAEVNEIATRRPVLVVPGGGPFADAVRALDARWGLDDAVAHRLALHAMDQLGVLLAPLLPGPEINVLSVVQAFAGSTEIPESWTVTSDSLAVFAAAAVGAVEAVLLKPVAGVLARWPSNDPPLENLTVAQLQALQDAGEGRAVDPYLPEAVRRTGVAVTVRSPGSGDTSGTRIALAFAPGAQ